MLFEKLIFSRRPVTIINYQPDTIGYLDLTFGPKWDYIPLTKNYVENFLAINLVDRVNISKISMSASELLENAVKFSNKDGIRMMVKKLNKQNQVILVVYNYTTKKEADDLIERVKDMNNQDPLQYYIEKMKESAVRNDGKSGLGLSRINYEGEAKLDIVYFDEEGIVQVRAVFRLF